MHRICTDDLLTCLLVCLQRQERFVRCRLRTSTAYVVVRTVCTRAAVMESFTTADATSAATGQFTPRSMARLPVAVGLQFTGLIFLPAASRAAQRAGISVTQMQILRFFAPQGRYVAPMGVKFGTEEGIEGPLLDAKFRPHRYNG